MDTRTGSVTIIVKRAELHELADALDNSKRYGPRSESQVIHVSDTLATRMSARLRKLANQ